MELTCLRAGIPRKSSKYSNGIYPVWTLLILAGLRQYENKSYRRFMEWLEVTDGIRAYLGLSRIPHYTTLHKFTQRIPHKWIHILLRNAYNRWEEPVIAAIDSTGFRSDHASQHYEKRLTQTCKGYFVKNHLKVTTAVETESQLIISYKVRRSPASDHRDFPWVVRRAAKAAPLGIVVADKGYDSEENHAIVRDELWAMSIIPPRGDGKVSRTTGRYRREMKIGYDEDLYHQRSKNETVNSVVKRVMSESVLARKARTQNRAIGIRFFAYNCQRLARMEV